MDRTLMNMIVDEGLVVTAVTLSRKKNITTSEANRAMTDFYKDHRDSNIWATYIVSGFCEKFGLPVRSSIVCREEDLENIKKQFLSVSSVTLFSLQAVKVEELPSILARDRLEDLKFFRTDAERTVILSKVVQHCAEELSVKLQSDRSDVVVAMKHMFDDEKSSPAKDEVKNPHKQQVAARELKKANPEDGKEHHNDLITQKKVKIDPEDVPTKRILNGKKNISNKTTVVSPPRTRKLNKEIFDDGDSSPEKSCEVPESSAAKPAQESDIKVEASTEGHKKLASDPDQEPPRKKKLIKTVETYKDEDGFLVTKEVTHMVESDEPEEEHSKPLRPANTIKATQAHHPRKKPAAAGTQKISAFFTKKA
ncbi:unnamed protein product [Cylicocyclus nassatus]|uniref:DNA polymerase delta subunit 3 n=1 Tax=Cylicocyclus nassatus TaxID=53992 RepID=A0AA36MFA8_CYLNA|nr:unnamed protein product [Cylicocyclus nassatus]